MPSKTRDSIYLGPNNLESVIFYDDLPDHFTKRAKKLLPVVKKMYPGLSLKDWINDFKYDLYPERELAKWEHEVKQYLDVKRTEKISPETNDRIWDKIMNKMNSGDYLEDVLKGNGIEYEKKIE